MILNARYRNSKCFNFSPYYFYGDFTGHWNTKISGHIAVIFDRLYCEINDSEQSECWKEGFL